MEAKPNNMFGDLVLRGPKPEEEEVVGGTGGRGEKATDEEIEETGDIGGSAGVGKEEKQVAARLEAKREKRKAVKKTKQEKKIRLMKEERKEAAKKKIS